MHLRCQQTCPLRLLNNRRPRLCVALRTTARSARHLHFKPARFIAAYWTMKIPAKQIRDVKSLNIPDSTNALSWMAKNNHRPGLQPFHHEVARRFGLTLFKTNSSADCGHLAGERNKISDSLSQDTHIPSPILIQQLWLHPHHTKVLRYLSGKQG